MKAFYVFILVILLSVSLSVSKAQLQTTQFYEQCYGKLKDETNFNDLVTVPIEHSHEGKTLVKYEFVYVQNYVEDTTSNEPFNGFYPQTQTKILGSKYYNKNGTLYNGNISALKQNGEIYFKGKIKNGRLVDTGFFFNGYITNNRDESNGTKKFWPALSPMIIIFKNDTEQGYEQNFVKKSAVIKLDDYGDTILNVLSSDSKIIAKYSNNNWYLVKYSGYKNGLGPSINYYIHSFYPMVYPKGSAEDLIDVNAQKPYRININEVHINWGDSIAFVIEDSNYKYITGNKSSYYTLKSHNSGYNELKTWTYFQNSSGELLNVIFAPDRQHAGYITFDPVKLKEKESQKTFQNTDINGNVITLQVPHFKPFKPIIVNTDSIFKLIGIDWIL